MLAHWLALRAGKAHGSGNRFVHPKIWLLQSTGTTERRGSRLASLCFEIESLIPHAPIVAMTQVSLLSPRNALERL
jgi:hypothetical protein